MPKGLAKIRSIVLKQYYVGHWLGAYKDTYGRSLAYYSMIQFFMVAGMAYFTPQIQDIKQLYFDWVNFPVYVAILIFIMLCIQLFVLKLEVPSSVSWGNKMAFVHENLIRKLINEEFAKIKSYNKKRFNKLEKMISKSHKPSS